MSKSEYYASWTRQGQEHVAIVVADCREEVALLLQLDYIETLSVILKEARVGKGNSKVVCQGVI